MSTPELRRWTRAEYQRMAEVGIFRPDQRVELIEGEIVVVPPPTSHRAVCISLIGDALRDTVKPDCDVRLRLPLALGEHSEPEPDVAVVPGAPRDYLGTHPTSALLVVEIADTSLAFDRDVKGGVYARAGIPDYWVVNLVHRQLEIHREPGPLPAAPGGFGYRTRTIFLPGETISPLARPDARLDMADLFP
ncbi:MAG: Uma2 family endonuclease [Chloroflexi bacterium]|nr:Uma2 family endonuclease [Chloroflexota bacterium]